ncbi:hypothetical protein [Hyalangium gracile]|uniref:hypothetical protein n=1 Tax=Hyalangium gracile TaxID=394092 RepID=UPI001CCB5ECF|nr:hypothetical protein [Hyalangium gracile]
MSSKKGAALVALSAAAAGVGVLVATVLPPRKPGSPSRGWALSQNASGKAYSAAVSARRGDVRASLTELLQAAHLHGRAVQEAETLGEPELEVLADAAEETIRAAEAELLQLLR